MDDPNLTLEEYIRLEEEKARKRGKVFNWQTATYGKIRIDDDLHDLSSVSAIVNEEIDFRISFDESDDEDYTVIYDENSFSYKMISVNDLKTNSENDYEKVMPSIPSPELAISCFDDLDFFNDFENKFQAISESDLLTELISNSYHIDEFSLNDKSSLSEATRSELERLLQQEKQTEHINNTNSFNTVSPLVSTAGPSFANAAPSSPINAAETPVTTSNAFEEHLFQQFSPFKNAFALPHVPNVSFQWGYTRIFGEEGYVISTSCFERSRFSRQSLQDRKGSLWTISSPKSMVQQKSDGIFISQDKYVAEILKKFDFATIKTASTPMEPNKALIKDEEAEDVDVHLYRLMIGSLMYLTASRPDITFAVCACVRFQVTPKTSHLHVVKRIFRYLKGQPKLGLWYPRDSPFHLEAFSDSEYTRASLNKKSTTGGTISSEIQLIQALVDGKKVIVNEGSIRRDLRPNDAEGAACLPNDTIFEESTRLGRKQRTEVSSSDEAEHEDNIPTTSNNLLPSDSKRHALWSLIEGISKNIDLKTNTPYPSRRYGVSVPAITKDHKRNEVNTPYPEDSICRIQEKEYNILEDIKCGPYSKKSPIRRIQLLGYAVLDRILDLINRKLKNEF
ncbi:hypothetical protein Tco_0457654 [Tanacetum coccineum]